MGHSRGMVRCWQSDASEDAIWECASWLVIARYPGYDGTTLEGAQVTSWLEIRNITFSSTGGRWAGYKLLGGIWHIVPTHVSGGL